APRPSAERLPAQRTVCRTLAAFEKLRVHPMSHPNYRADHVGSLLRPPELLQARADFSGGRINEQQLEEAEDRAIDKALALQRAVGIQVLSDGEYRRHDWVGDFTSSVDGYVTA